MASELFHLTSPNSTTPSAANNPTFAPSGTSWVFGSYQTLLSSAAVDTLIIGVSVLVQSETSLAFDWEVELATGAAGSEVTLASLPGVGSNGAINPQRHLTFPAPLKIAAGTRVAGHVRKSNGGTNPAQIDLITVPAAYTGTLYPTSAAIACVPYGSSDTATCSATAWANGAVVELSHSMPTDALIFALKAAPDLLGWPGEYELDLLTGASGSEVPISGIRDATGQLDPGWQELPAPVFVAAGTRLSVRLRSGVGAANNLKVGAVYYETPGSDYPSDLQATAAPVFAPSAANSISVTSGAAGAYGSWVQVLASAATDLALVDAIIDTLPVDGHIQVGVGAPGSEVSVATISVSGNSSNASQAWNPLPVPVASIPSGSRVSIRYVTGPATSTTSCALLFLPQSGLSALKTTTIPMVMPDACGITNVGNVLPAPGGAWSSGAWVQMTAGNTNPGAIYGLALGMPDAANKEFEIDIGVGASGSESVIYTFRSCEPTTGGRQLLMADALVPFAASTRVAARMRVQATGGTWSASVLYYDNLVFTPPAIVGSGAVGYKAKVIATLAWLFNLDGTARTLSAANTLLIGGALVVTGAVTFAASAVSGLLDTLASTLGDTLYRGSSLWTRLAGNTTATKQFLTQTGTGSASAAPVWGTVADADVTFSNVTTGNVSTSKHGYTPILPNDATKYLDGTGNYSVPSGGGSSGSQYVGLTIDGAGSVITTGTKGFVLVPKTGTIKSVTVLSTDASATAGSIVIDVWDAPYSSYPPTVANSIVASDPPTLSSANKSQDTTLTGWTTSVTKGDVLGFHVNSASTVTRVTLIIEIQ